ncbi:MAG: tetratricopeptide repeat protein [Bacteroidia bacterium]|jgi:anti-sigma factor RsiW|nr:tetratricopeptide repeat protein [Bacteroidia bacterium]
MADQFTYPLLPQSPCLTEEQLLAYIDGKMSAAEQHEAELHITDCALCSDAIDGWKLVKDRSKALQFPAEVAMTAAAPETATEPEEKHEPKVIPLQPKRRLWMSIAASVAVILVIAATITIIVPHKDKQLAENTAAKKPNSSNQSLPAPPADQNVAKNQAPVPAAELPQPVIEVGPTTYYSQESVTDEPAPGYLYEDLASAAPPEKNDAMTMTEMLKQEDDNRISAGAADDEQKKAPADKDQFAVVKADSTVTSGSGVQLSSTATSPSYQWNTSGQTVGEVVVADEKVERRRESAQRAKTKSKAASAKPSAPSQAEAESEMPSNPNYTLGMSLMQQKKYNEAIAQFDKVLAVKTNLNYSDAQWQKALALIQLGKKEEARTLLQEIVAGNGTYKARAEAELKKL